MTFKPTPCSITGCNAYKYQFSRTPLCYQHFRQERKLHEETAPPKANELHLALLHLTGKCFDDPENEWQNLRT